MRITHIDHFNISLKHAALETIRDFYVNVIGLTEGARPNFNFPGYWLYGVSEASILHLAVVLPDDSDGISPGKSTGQFDHISLKASDATSAWARLKAAGVQFD